MASFVNRSLFFSTATIFVFAASTCFAQSSIGVELGLGQYTQHGSYLEEESHVETDNGKGIGFAGSVFYQSKIASDFFWGMNFGLDFKHTTESITTTIHPYSTIDTSFGPVNATNTVDLHYLSIVPYLGLKIPGTEFYVQAGPNISILVSQNTPWSWSFVDPNQTFEGVHGNSRTGGLITTMKSLQFSALFSAGYNIRFSDFKVGPIISYNLPFSSILQYSNLNFSSFYGSIALSYDLK